jgi:hypothetical protein
VDSRSSTPQCCWSNAFISTAEWQEEGNTEEEIELSIIRHVQQHTGELCERLGATGDIEVEWIGTKSD